MANTRADIGPIGELPTFGNSQVPQSADINSYSDRMLAREAGASAETSSRIFEGLSAKLGAAADQAAHFEGTMAGKVAGNDPNYRPDPNASETIRGRAFADAANATYLNNIDAQSKAAASQVYDQYLALPPGQRQPAVLAQGLDRVHNEFLKDHLFPEIAGEFNQRYTNWSTGFLQGAARDLEATTRDQAKASFIQSNNANYDVAMKLASVGDDSVAPQLHAAVQQGLAKIDGSVASGAISAVEGVAQKQQLRNDTWLADMQARRLKLPPDQRPAFDAVVNKQGAYFLEWTPRLGIDSELLSQRAITNLSELLVRLAHGRDVEDLFSIGTALSSNVVHKKHGGVLVVTWSSLDRSCTSSGGGLVPSKLLREP